MRLGLGVHVGPGWEHALIRRTTTANGYSGAWLAFKTFFEFNCGSADIHTSELCIHTNWLIFAQVERVGRARGLSGRRALIVVACASLVGGCFASHMEEDRSGSH